MSGSSSPQSRQLSQENLSRNPSRWESVIAIKLNTESVVVFTETTFGNLTKYKYTYIEYRTTVYVMYVPSSELGLSHPLCRQRVCPSPQNQMWGAHSPADEGLGESQYRRLEKKLSTLPTLRGNLFLRCWQIVSKFSVFSCFHSKVGRFGSSIYLSSCSFKNR